MRFSMMSACLFVLMAPANVWSQAPTVSFVSPGPGLNAPFVADSAVDTYGVEQFVAGWAWDTFSGSPVTPNPIARYSTSLENDNATVTPMSPLDDWVFSFSYGISDSLAANDQVILAKTNDSTPNEKKVFDLLRTGNSVTLRAGNAADGWDPVAAPIDMTPPFEGETFVDFVIHYKSTTNTIDAWADNIKIAADFTLGHADYALEFFQMQPSGELGKDKFRLLKIGQLAVTAVDNADFDGDTDVDGVDFLAWQRGFGSAGSATLSDGDANADTNVDGADLAIWNGQFGTTSSVAAISAVPEPTSLLLVVLGLLGTLGRRSRGIA